MDNRDALNRWGKQIIAGAERYRNRTGKVPTLIVDNVNQLARSRKQERLELLEIMQGSAKKWADERLLKVVFMPSTGLVQMFMQERSSWSRCGEILEIDDVDQNSAVSYLKQRGVSPEVATKAYTELTGGRPLLLDRMARKVTHMSYPEVKRAEFDKAKADFEAAGFFNKDATGEFVRGITKAILASETKRIPIDHSSIVSNRHLFHDLLRFQVFAFHHEGNSVTFESRLAESFASSITISGPKV